ncbi:Sensor histidine kinase TmoS [bacterium HR12]|nr:Sensor histidine kinase TmoS [bacterium HR12]
MSEPRPRNGGGLRDLLAISAILAVLLGLASRLHLLEELIGAAHRRLGAAEDEVVFGLLLATAGLAAFATRRWLFERREQRARWDAETRYRALIEHMPAVLYTRGPTTRAGPGAVRYVSPQVERILGFTREEWRADPRLWRRRIHQEDRDRVIEAAHRAEGAGEPLAAEYRFLRKDGSEIWVRDEAVVVERDRRGRPVLIQGFLYDITERKRAEEAVRETEARYRALVEQVPAVTYTWDPSVAPGAAPAPFVSPQIQHLLGYTPEEWLANPMLWHERIHEEDRGPVLEAWDLAVRTRAPFRAEYRVRARDGRWLWIRDEAAPVSGNRDTPRLYQGVMYDITERKLAEEALRESERREREAAERLRALDEMKNTFLAAVSHELRSPLTSILGLAVTLEQTPLPDEERADLLARLTANARKLDRLLTDLLDIDRLNRGIVAPVYRVTDVGALVGRTVESLDALGERAVSLQLEPVVAEVDPAKVERIVENLLANAARHTTPDARIWVRVTAEGDGVVIAVEDDGPGVPPELREEIFRPFRQGPTASPHAPGTGIGLSLVAMFAELHGGRAWVQDREGGGASFRVFLPARPAAPSSLETLRIPGAR